MTDLATKFEKQSSHRRGILENFVPKAFNDIIFCVIALLEQEKILSDVMADHANKMQGEMATLLLGKDNYRIFISCLMLFSQQIGLIEFLISQEICRNGKRN